MGAVSSAFISSPLQGKLLTNQRACGMGEDLGLKDFVIESADQVAIKLSVVSAVVWDIRQLGLELK